MTELKRLKKTINWLIFSEFAENEALLSKKLGYKKSSFSQIMNGKVPLSDKFLNKIEKLDPNINKIWIKTGDGEMFKSEIKENSVSNNKEMDLLNKIITLQDENKELMKENKELALENQKLKTKLKEKTSVQQDDAECATA
jgi:hypothetical protein